MKFNAEKCEIITFSKKLPDKTVQYNYILHNTVLTRVKTAKYLGLTFTDNLSWSNHINNITNKGSRMLGLLRRNLYMASEDLRDRAYCALVRPSLEYAGTVWDPYTKDHIKQLEAVQRRSARFVCQRYNNTSSVSNMLQHLGWSTLEERRKKSKLTLMHKITHNHIAIKKDEVLTPKQQRSSRTFNNLAYRQFITTQNYHKYSFFPGTVPIWNKLSNDIVCVEDPASFKQKLAGLNITKM
jgi:hypothetical protein